MKSTEKQKMCIHCEGRIPIEAEICEYCASYQTDANVKNSFQAPLFQNQTLEDSLTSLYTPPYQGKKPNFSQSPAKEEPMFSAHPQTPMYKDVAGQAPRNPFEGATVNTTEEESQQKNSLWPTLFLTTGIFAFVVGLMQCLFSKNGTLHLEWDTNYWFLYCLLGAPLLYFGIKKLRELD